MIGGEKALALIAARGGSKGIPGKNIIPVGGRPLIEWTIEAARGSRYIDKLILSSDSPAIIEVATKAGCESPFRRDASLATDEASSIDVVIDALSKVPGYDVVILLQPTSPLRIAADIDGALELMQSSGAPACVSVRGAEEHPYLTYRMELGGKLSPYAGAPDGFPMRRQDLPPAFCLNGAVYAARVDWLMRTRNFLTAETVGYPMPAERSIDVDTSLDLEAVERMIQR